jgi:hypothetical protein
MLSGGLLTKQWQLTSVGRPADRNPDTTVATLPRAYTAPPPITEQQRPNVKRIPTAPSYNALMVHTAPNTNTTKAILR